MAELDLVQEELRELASPVIEAAGNPSEPFGVYAFAATDPESELARSVERAVFLEAFGNEPETLASEYDQYEASTAFYCVIDHRRRLPAGSMRMILPSPQGLKTFRDIETQWGSEIDGVLARTGVTWEASRSWDVTTLAVAPEYRGKATDGLISLALYQALILSALAGDARWLVTILDMKPLELIQSITIECFQFFEGLEPISYLGSPLSVPVFIDLLEYEPRVLAKAEDMHGIFFRGVGIEAAVRRAEWAPLLRVLGREPAAPALVRR